MTKNNEKERLEKLILGLDLPEEKKKEFIKLIYSDWSIPIIGIANELSELKVELKEEERSFIKELYSKYGW